MEIKVMPLHACIKASMCHSYVVERGVSRSIALCSSHCSDTGKSVKFKSPFLGFHNDKLPKGKKKHDMAASSRSLARAIQPLTWRLKRNGDVIRA